MTLLAAELGRMLGFRVGSMDSRLGVGLPVMGGAGAPHQGAGHQPHRIGPGSPAKPPGSRLILLRECLQEAGTFSQDLRSGLTISHGPILPRRLSLSFLQLAFQLGDTCLLRGLLYPGFTGVTFPSVPAWIFRRHSVTWE